MKETVALAAEVLFFFFLESSRGVPLIPALTSKNGAVQYQNASQTFLND